MIENKGLISCDLASIPKNLEVDKFIYIIKEFNIIFYDSMEGGQKPEVLKEFEEDKIILDYSTELGKAKLKEINKNINEEHS